MAYSVQSLVDQILVKNTTPDKYVRVITIMSIIGLSAYIFISYGCYGNNYFMKQSSIENRGWTLLKQLRIILNLEVGKLDLFKFYILFIWSALFLNFV